MPLEWVDAPSGAPEISGASSYAKGEPPLACLHLWPNRSLPKRGFAAFMGATFALVLLPMLAVLGTPVMWALMPFMLGTVALIWAMLQKSYRDGEILEELRLWSDHAVLTRSARGRAPLVWEANPHWISVHLHAVGGPVENYITLKGAGREVELGAFLSTDEREALHPVLNRIVRRAAASVTPG